MQPVQKVLTTMLWACAVLAMVSVIGANMWRGRAGARLESDGEVHIGPATQQDGNVADGDARPTGDGPVRLTREAPAFALIDQNEKPVTLETLKGKPFIANFIFTNCAGPCPLMTQKMAKLQEAVPVEVKLVSFSVDPTTDRPAVLKKYAANFKADDARWHFLTVADPADASAVYTLARG